MKSVRKKISKIRMYTKRKKSYLYFLGKKSRLQKLKNKFQNERCFIIGNGPSLSEHDLNRLNGEYCFGSNRIYKSFEKVEWRPNFYVIVDKLLLRKIKKDLKKIIRNCEYTFINADLCDLKSYMLDTGLLYVNDEKFEIPDLPKFSQDISEGVFEGFTVTYTCIQMAVYFGFKEIYLLGVDHNYSKTLSKDGGIKTENAENYSKLLEVDDKTLKDENIPRVDWTTNAYIKAKQVCDSKNIVIKNATRGGKLEVFDRIDFDKLVR